MRFQPVNDSNRLLVYMCLECNRWAGGLFFHGRARPIPPVGMFWLVFSSCEYVGDEVKNGGGRISI